MHRTRWGAYNLNEITPAEIHKWVTERSSTVSQSTMVNEISPLRRAFKLAVKHWQYLKEDPTRDISFRTPPVRTPKHLSDDEVQILLELAQAHDAKRLNPAQHCKCAHALSQTPDDLRKKRYNKDGTFDTARIRFLLLSALRRSQFFDLKWNQYDEKRGTVTLQTSDEHSEKSRRVNVIPLPSAALAIIEGQPRNSDYIFPNLIGERDGEMTRRFGRIFTAFEKRTGRHIHLHMLRHTALTQLLRHSQNIAAVSRYAGHSDVKTTQIYAHILDDQLQSITKNFNISSAPVVSKETESAVASPPVAKPPRKQKANLTFD